MLAAMVAAATPSMGQLVYLTCTLTDRPDWIMDVQLNEAGGSASVHYRHGGNQAVSRQAAFAPDRVAFDDYIISRGDLTFTKDNRNSWVAQLDKLPTIELGKCEIDSRVRKF